MYLQQQIGTCRGLAERASWEPCEWQVEPRWLRLGCERGMRGGKVGKDRTGLLWDQISEDGAGLCRLGFTLRALGATQGWGRGSGRKGPLCRHWGGGRIPRG